MGSKDDDNKKVASVVFNESKIKNNFITLKYQHRWECNDQCVKKKVVLKLPVSQFWSKFLLDQVSTKGAVKA